MAEIDKQTTEKAKKLLRVQYGINEHYNPLVRIPADLYRYYSKCTCTSYVCTLVTVLGDNVNHTYGRAGLA